MPRYVVCEISPGGLFLIDEYRQGSSVAETLEGLYRWLHQTIRSFDTTRENLDEAGTKVAEGLMSPHDMALRMSLQAAQAADVLPASIALADESVRAQSGQEEMVYEFVSEVNLIRTFFRLVVGS